jgi:hypothetical protein
LGFNSMTLILKLAALKAANLILSELFYFFLGGDYNFSIFAPPQK